MSMMSQGRSPLEGLDDEPIIRRSRPLKVQVPAIFHIAAWLVVTTILWIWLFGLRFGVVFYNAP